MRVAVPVGISVNIRQFNIYKSLIDLNVTNRIVKGNGIPCNYIRNSEIQSFANLRDAIASFKVTDNTAPARIGAMLTEIHDTKLYKNGNHKSFNAFINEELPISRRTAYNYMDLSRIFGVEAFNDNPGVAPGKLICALSI